MKRRALLASLLFACSLWAPAATAPWPERPIKVIVPFAAGTPADSVARIIARALQKSLYQPVLVENRPGGDGVAAATFVKGAPPDGYTLLFATSSSLAAPLIQRNVGLEPLVDFAPISTVGGFPYAMFVNPKVPVRSAQELVAYARNSKLSYGTANAGEHFAAAQLSKATGIEMTRVPYNASPVSELAAGRIQLYIGPVSQALNESKSGRVRLLATLTSERTALTPTVPSLAEETLPVPPGNINHQMLLAPAKTPSDVVAKLAREVQAAVAIPAVRAELQGVSLVPRASSPGELARDLAEANKLWRQFVIEAGLAAR
jgi:tripartite-type tricarboxylate transporter receptor subunit TctC